MSSPSLENNPRLDSWLTIEPGGRVLVRSGKVELGQGVLTALAQIVADELDVDLARVAMVAASTDASPDESYTAGSLSVQHSGGALRAVCAQVRALHLAAAAEALRVPAGSLSVADGEFVAPDGRRTSYWELTVPLDADVVPGSTPKGAGDHAVVGRSALRLDVPDKVAGRPRFIHDLQPAGLLHGRVVRPPSRGAVLLSVDESAAQRVPGVVAVVRDGSFLGVVAEREENALRALAALQAGCAWKEQDSLPPEHALADFLVSAPTEETVLSDTDTAAASAARSVRARFARPYLAHASIAPSCGLAVWEGGRLSVWSHSQGIYKLRTAICRLLELAPEDVVVQHVEGAGCYGHNAADDAAYDAVLLAPAVPGRPVRVVWTREDELSWGPLGPAMVVDIAVHLDDAGAVQRWQQDVWSNGHSHRPGPPGAPLLAATHVEAAVPNLPASDPPLQNGGGSGRNAVPLYDLPRQLVRTHRLQTMPLRTSALRALGAHLNVYAIESVVDELAVLAGEDPVGYRLGMLSDERARAVLTAAAERAGWGSDRGPDVGLGVGLARYKNRGAWCAVVAEVEAETSVRVRRLTIAVDVGLVVNPDGVVNQIEGGALQALSWTTKEQVRFDARTVTSRTWEDYPILTFSEVPPVDVVLLDRPAEASLGAGEASIGPTAAAIGNALYAATGLRVRTLPLTSANVVAAMDAG
ncbi:molybdopterin cofactor-binding domain-containing protein [Blastococcus sp. CT_GayMR16]|uniref:xanthine dehydrogenase family protein molybdopterin-binding subunit n=1 Tax=Blastococcus sp. CT_GayMR16 TaxID=2559607 RepID=UPI0010743769|nr:molybdopterin cofactor-binding domain-containing protein [Blastococcus sp. CT_GayMR16]TFV89607.1 xanthine dehydrogenase family protein molybdopterin-binding subunit [Blastococcus sp. CT_GayMR16]